MADKPLHIALIDDHPIVIEGLEKILLRDLPVSQLLVHHSATEFLNIFSEQATFIDLVLLDITLPDKNGIEVCREIKAYSPKTIVLGFSNHNDKSIILQMLNNGASGYLLKNASASELIFCIKEALKGQIIFSDEVKKIITNPANQPSHSLPPLTKREKEILKMIASGKTSNEIAELLFISPLTVETHRRNLMQKFEVKNVASLINTASLLKLID
jgi:DNA-binding NarL/FixJ family response regulator